MRTLFTLLSVSSFFIFASINSASCDAPPLPEGSRLPRVAEQNRFSPQAIDAFLKNVDEEKLEFHSIMIVKDGEVVYEKWFGEHAPDKIHILNSVSKTFTSMAVGFAVSEGLLKTDDKVVSFFPDDLPEEISENLAALTVKDLLTMSVGHAKEPLESIRNTKGNWEKMFLSVPIPNRPGSKFLYNSMATYMLSSIVQKVAGEKLLDYLEPRLFKPLGITGAEWAESPNGVNTGGWGLFVKTEDMAKLGLLLLQKGKWNGKQILPESWIDEATTAWIMQSSDRDQGDWNRGYGYQIWRCRHNAYRADGKNGQFIIVMPEQNAVIAITANTPRMGTQLELVWKHLLPAL